MTGIDRRVRTRVITGGRTRNADDLPLSVPFVASAEPPPIGAVGPDHGLILNLCTNPQTLADLSSRLTTPIAALRVLVLDLVALGGITVHHPSSSVPAHRDVNLLLEALDGIANL